MFKLSKAKFSVTIFLTLMIISSSYAFFIPNAHAMELTTEQKGLSALSNVLGLDLAKYYVTSDTKSQQMPFLGGVEQESVLYNLTSTNSKLNVFYTYENGNLQSLYVLGSQGSPILTKPTPSVNVIESAKNFLTNYQINSGEQVFGQLATTLTNIEPSKNVTKSFGNTVLELTTYNNSQTFFKWYYTANGAVAQYTKAIAIGFENGFLTSFIDNWNLYPVGSTAVNLSKDQATIIALDIAKNHNWTIPLDKDTLDPSNFNVEKSISWSTLVFDTSVDLNVTRSKNVLELYPVWKVGIVLNKAYGELCGLEVDIWADNKQVRSINEQYSQLAAQWMQNVTTNINAIKEQANQSLTENTTVSLQNNQAFVNGLGTDLTSGFAFIIAISSAVAVSGVVLINIKKLNITHQLKPRSLKTFGLLLCCLMLLVVFSPLVESASASNAGIIWGAQSTGASNYPVSHSWRKTDGEISRQWYVTGYLGSNFFTSANGYSGFCNEGVNKDVILYQAGYLRDNFNNMAVLDWDHGVGGNPPQTPNEDHYMFEDDWGTVYGAYPGQRDWSHGVYDMDIYNTIPPAKAHFVFIDACQSANLYRLGQGYLPSGNPVGLPFAFTHRIVTYSPSGTQMSADGYQYPDPYPQCYIGFPSGSAALDQQITYMGQNGGPRWYTWIIFFYYFALDFNISIKDALDMASYQTWQCNGYLSSPLQGAGFNAVWPMYFSGQWHDYTGPYSTLAVYGNGNVHLRYFSPGDMLTAPDISGPIQGQPGYSYTFNTKAIDFQGHSIRYLFDWGDGTQEWTDGYTTNGVEVSKAHTWNSPGIYSVKVQGLCENGQWSGWSNTINIAVGDYYWLTIDAWDNYGNQLNVGVTVDGQFIGSTPISTLVSADWHSVSVDAYPGYWYLTGFSDGYGNGDYRPIYSDTWITAYYQSYW